MLPARDQRMYIARLHVIDLSGSMQLSRLLSRAKSRYTMYMNCMIEDQVLSEVRYLKTNFRQKGSKRNSYTTQVVWYLQRLVFESTSVVSQIIYFHRISFYFNHVVMLLINYLIMNINLHFFLICVHLQLTNVNLLSMNYIIIKVIYNITITVVQQLFLLSNFSSWKIALNMYILCSSVKMAV